MPRNNQSCLGIFVIVSFRIFIILVLIRIWSNNYSQDKIVIFRGVLDEIDEILSILTWYKGVRVIVLLLDERLAVGLPSTITSFFPLNISRFNGIYYTIIIILEMDSSILIQEIGFALLIIFRYVSGIPTFLNIETELPHRRRLYISMRLTRRLTRISLKLFQSYT